jgi:hypothetical protein
MKTVVILLALCFAVCAIGLATNAGAATTGASCTFKEKGFPVYIRVTASNKSACNLFASKIAADPGKMYFVSSPLGRRRCTFMVQTVFLSVFTTARYSAPICNHFTDLFQNADPSGTHWERLS